MCLLQVVLELATMAVMVQACNICTGASMPAGVLLMTLSHQPQAHALSFPFL